MRINVIGNAGTGKTTLAAQLAQRFVCPHIELDELHWGANWQMAETEHFRRDVAEAIRGDAWVVDGNYTKVRDILWTRVQWVVWLDYALAVVVWRLVRRSTRRIITREELWDVRNSETIRGQLFDEDALIPYAIKHHRRRREKFVALVRQPEYAHINFVRLQTPRRCDRWLAEFDPRNAEVGR